MDGTDPIVQDKLLANDPERWLPYAWHFSCFDVGAVFASLFVWRSEGQAESSKGKTKIGK
jgi:hypothetical protein